VESFSIAMPILSKNRNGSLSQTCLNMTTWEKKNQAIKVAIAAHDTTLFVRPPLYLVHYQTPKTLSSSFCLNLMKIYSILSINSIDPLNPIAH
jgi:hypothetical protein